MYQNTHPQGTQTQTITRNLAGLLLEDPRRIPKRYYIRLQFHIQSIWGELHVSTTNAIILF